MARALSSAAGALDLLQLWRELNPSSTGRIYCAVAWSGGLDSTVLLHLLVKLREQYPKRLRLRALHVDHHLQAASAEFRAHCKQMARRWRVPLKILDVAVKTGTGDSLEEAARDARYAAWKAELSQGEILLTAQHADDQIETVLLALMRGGGPAGLAAMPRSAALGHAQLMRPLLHLPRALLQQYALQQGISWVEDPTNQQLRFDRNYLRAEILPRLQQRWPAVRQTVARSARHSARLVAAQAASCALDLELAADGADLDVTVLRRWPVQRQLAVLRAWFARANLRSPETRHLEQILLMFNARVDAHPLLTLAEASVRVQGGRLILEAGRRAAATPIPPQNWLWRQRELDLTMGTLAVRTDPHGDLDIDRLPAQLAVRSLATAPGRGRSLRKLFQEMALPQWEREGLPLLYAPNDGKLLAIADHWVHPDLRSRADSRRRGRFVWRSQR